MWSGSGDTTWVGLPIHQEAWHRLKGWYLAAVHCAPAPTQVTLEQITADLVDLYRYISPPEENIRIFIDPFLLEDSVPTEDDIG